MTTTLISKKKTICYSAILLFMLSSVQAQFVHPGLWHKKSDLDRMKYMVESGLDPWKTSFNNLKSDSKSSFNYVVRKDPADNTLSRENPSHQRYEYETDALAAYQNALMWYITGDTRHANKSIEILNAWSSLVNFYGGGTEPLCAGLYGAPLINAAEIIKSTYNGWSASDIQAFKDMLVYPGYSNTTVPQTDINNNNVTFYWRTFMGDPKRHGNQGLLAWRTVMAIGVFLDNQIIYDRALRYIQRLPHRSDDLPYTSGPPKYAPLLSENEYFIEYDYNGVQITTQDYGYDDQIENYIYDNGQCQESSRDQVHSSLGLSTIAEIMEVAWNQGTDIYGFLNNRLLKGLEFTAKYNLSFEKSFPDQTIPWEPDPANYYQYRTRTRRWKSLKINPWYAEDLTRNSRGSQISLRPVYEMQAAHFNIRAGKQLDALWTNRSLEYAIDVNGYEKGSDIDVPGWGGLSFRRPVGCAGDPITGFSGVLPTFGMNVLPRTIEAENFDFFSGIAEGRTYHDETTTNSGAAYRTNDAVDIETVAGGGYNLTSIESGEWLTYTVSVPETKAYSFSIRYAASQAGGTMKFSFGGEDKTIDLAVPFGGINSNGDSDWKDYVISNNVILNKGVQSLKISFGGVSGAFKLDNFSIVSDIVKQDQSIKFFTISHKVIGSPDFDPTAKASSGLNVEYTSSNPAVATIVNGKIHLVGIGKTTITASQIGDAYYNPAISVAQELSVVNAIAGTINLNVNHDSYVYGGSNANTNYGALTTMVSSANGSNGRYVYLKFDLSSIPGPIISAKLNLYQRVSGIDTRNVYDVANDNWTETTLTWANKPAYENERASFTTNSSKFCQWDVSSYVAQEYANDKIVTIAIDDPKSISLVGIDFYTKENLTSVPQLVIQYADNSLSVADVDIPIPVYPNPVVKDLFISLGTSSLNIKDAEVTIFNLNGQKVFQTKIDSSEVRLDLSKLNKGLYILTIKDKSKRIIKKIEKI